MYVQYGQDQEKEELQETARKQRPTFATVFGMENEMGESVYTTATQEFEQS